MILITVVLIYLSTRIPGTYPNVLGTSTTAPSDMPIIKQSIDYLYAQLPPSSQELIQNINQNPILNSLDKKITLIKEITGDFPNRQIGNIKIYFLQRAQGVLKQAEQNSQND